MDSTGGMFPLEQSKLYEFRQAEQKAIETHKWHLSERAGHDVGMDYAGWNWIMAGHRERWISGLKAAGEYPLS